MGGGGRLGSTCGESGGRLEEKLMHTHPVEQSGLEGQATTLSIYPSLMLVSPVIPAQENSGPG